MTSGSLALLQIDLWAVKDGQINIFCILDRIRVSGTCSHLHIALTYHISIVFVAHFNRFGGTGGFLPLHPMLFQSVLAVAWLCWFTRPNRNHTVRSDFFQLQPSCNSRAAAVVKAVLLREGCSSLGCAHTDTHMTLYDDAFLWESSKVVPRC